MEFYVTQDFFNQFNNKLKQKNNYLIKNNAIKINKFHFFKINVLY